MIGLIGTQNLYYYVLYFLCEINDLFIIKTMTINRLKTYDHGETRGIPVARALDQRRLTHNLCIIHPSSSNNNNIKRNMLRLKHN